MMISVRPLRAPRARYINTRENNSDLQITRLSTTEIERVDSAMISKKKQHREDVI